MNEYKDLAFCTTKYFDYLIYYVKMIVIFFILFPTLMANPIRQDSTIEMKKEDKNSTVTPDFAVKWCSYVKTIQFHPVYLKY